MRKLSIVAFLALPVMASAECMTLQGVTLCDNGDRQLQLANQIYTLTDDKLAISDVKNCETPAIKNALVYEVNCPRVKQSYVFPYGVSVVTLSALGYYFGDSQ